MLVAAGAVTGVGSSVPARAAGQGVQISPEASPAFAGDAPDPDVVRVGSTYYAYTTGTTWGNRIGVLQSSSPATGYQTITGRSYGSTALPQLPGWEQPNTQTSPGVFLWGGRWVMFYDAVDPAEGGHYCLTVATASAPTGPFVDNSSAPLECQTNLGGSVDPSPFVDGGGRPWLYWKSNDGSSSQPATLWVAPLDSTGTGLAGAPTTVLAQDTNAHPWETTIENPDMVLAGGTYYLFFAGGQYNSTSYAEGYAVCGGPTGPCQQPQTGPILTSYGGAAGPGAGVAFQDQSGGWWMSYAAWTPGCTDYSCGGARELYVGALSFGGSAPATCSPPSPAYGYRMVAADGGIFDFGSEPFCGSAAGRSGSPTVGMASTADGGGYWVVSSSGAVTAFGDARWWGDSSGRGGASVVAMAPTADGGGYLLAHSDGSVDAYGDAVFHGSAAGTRLAAPVVGMAIDRATGGYWLFAADGGVFAYGAPFLGSAGGLTLVAPVVGGAGTPDGHGYWLDASDGGVFTYGDAPFKGAMGGHRLNQPVVGMSATPSGAGYRLVASDGGIFDFGDAAFYGSTGSLRLAQPIVGMG
ncbi:MAG TPA: family 43 glycosylhydrolase [Acidimicrobiales bacterium]|nr:family 43 glycosylhydrolase [Acidimicrobiales bacterium]